MAKLELFLLGMPQIYVDDQVVTGFNTRKDCALLAYLAVTGTRHSRESLAGLLWSQLPEDKARRNLRHALSHLQKVIGPQWLTMQHGVALTREHAWRVDVHTLRSTIQNLTASPHLNTEPTATQTMVAVEQVLQLYRGEFLQGFHVHEAAYFEEWVLAQREEMRLLTLRGLEILVQRCLVQGAYEQGLTATRHLLRLEPWSEPVHRLQMQLLVHHGQRAAALAQYAQCREILATELGVEPEQATVTLYEQIRQGQGLLAVVPPPAVAPPPSIAPVAYFLPAFSHNLPGQLTLFIGRDDDIRHIRRLLLAPEYRLISVVGEGGIGKTRLAMAVAQSFVDEAQHPATPAAGNRPLAQPFPDGIGYVPLAGLTVGEMLTEQLVTAVAKALRLQFSGKEPPLQQLQHYLHDKTLLLLIDNVEHLLPHAADFLVELLQCAPQLKVVATSRHLLNLQAEMVVRLAGLSMPPLQELATLIPTALLAYSSVALFVERAQHANSTFRVTAANQAAVVQICHLVHGLPLAIELAATLTRKYTCQQILNELQVSYTVLNSTLRDLVPRHRSIRTMLDYSWQFLSAEAAHLLAACSVFRGTFDHAAVAAIVGATLESLLMLVDQSLLQLVPGDVNPAQPCFVLHALIRQYGAAQLQTQPAEVECLRTAHCRYYLTLLNEQSRIFVHDLAALQRMQNDLDNLRAAWSWAGAQGQWDLMTASAYPLRQFYDLLGLSHEAERAFAAALAQFKERQAQQPVAWATQARLVAHLQLQQAHFCKHLEQFAQAEALTQAALALGQQLDDPTVQGYAYLCLSTVHGRTTAWADAQRAAEQALRYAQAAGLRQVEVQSLQNIGCAYLYRGELAQALDYLHRALAKHAVERESYIEGWLCLDLGNAYQLAGELMQARAYYQQVVQIYDQINNPMLGTYALACLSELHGQLGCFDQARSDAQMAWELSRTTTSRAAEGTALVRLAYAHYRLGDWGRAEQACQALFDRIQPLGLTVIRPFAYFLQGELQRSESQWQAALAAYATAQQVYVTIEQQAQALSAQAKIAQVWQQVGQLSKALAQVEEILPHLSQTRQNSWLETTADYLICYQVLAAAADPRATLILQQGYHYLQAQAQLITDEALRHSYLTHVPANRALVELAAQLKIPASTALGLNHAHRGDMVQSNGKPKQTWFAFGSPSG